MQAGCWCRRIIIEAVPEFAWFMIPLPNNKRHASSSEPQTWSIATDSVKRNTVDAAWEVTDFLCNVDNSSAIAYGDWLFPTRQSALSDPRFTTEENGWKNALDQLQYGKAYPKHPAWGEFDDRVLGPNLQKYLQNEMSQDELIDLLNEEGAELLAQYQAS
jgi:multiple sugar transport system substrate-binding protein